MRWACFLLGLSAVWARSLLDTNPGNLALEQAIHVPAQLSGDVAGAGARHLLDSGVVEATDPGGRVPALLYVSLSCMSAALAMTIWNVVETGDRGRRGLTWVTRMQTGRLLRNALLSVAINVYIGAIMLDRPPGERTLSPVLPLTCGR